MRTAITYPDGRRPVTHLIVGPEALGTIRASKLERRSN